MSDTTNVLPIETPAKPKRVRASRAKAPVAAPTPVDVPTRNMTELKDVEFKDMTREELVSVATTLQTQVIRAKDIIDDCTREYEILEKRLEKTNATFAYIKQTIEHANTSILLQIGNT
jgi:hypothetical protein